MAIIYENPFKEVRKPEQLEAVVAVAKDSDATYQNKVEAISKLRAAISFHNKLGHKVAVTYMRKVLAASVKETFFKTGS